MKVRGVSKDGSADSEALSLSVGVLLTERRTARVSFDGKVVFEAKLKYLNCDTTYSGNGEKERREIKLWQIPLTIE